MHPADLPIHISFEGTPIDWDEIGGTVCEELAKAFEIHAADAFAENVTYRPGRMFTLRHQLTEAEQKLALFNRAKYEHREEHLGRSITYLLASRKMRSFFRSYREIAAIRYLQWVGGGGGRRLDVGWRA